MAQVSALKRRTTGLGWSPMVEGTDQALLPELEGTVATRNLWNDAAAVTINVGTGAGLTSANLAIGANVATIQVGVATTTTTFPGSVAIQGVVTTVATTNLVVSDNLILINDGGAGANSGVAIERGITGDDALVFWNEGVTRFELGLFNTVGGTTTPAGVLTTLVDGRMQNLSLSAGGVTADTNVVITATGANSITFATNGVSQWNINSAGDLVTVAANNLGNAGGRVGTGTFTGNIEMGVANGDVRVFGFAGAGAVNGSTMRMVGGAGGTTSSGRNALMQGGDAGSNVASSGGDARLIGGSSTLAAQAAGGAVVQGGTTPAGNAGAVAIHGSTVTIGGLALQTPTDRWVFEADGDFRAAATLDNTMDWGSGDGGTTTLRPRTVYVGTSVEVGDEAGTGTVRARNATTAATAGGTLTFRSGSGLTGGNAGSINIFPAAGNPAGGNAGSIQMTAGASGASATSLPGNIIMSAGAAGGGNLSGGSVNSAAGSGAGTATGGSYGGSAGAGGFTDGPGGLAFMRGGQGGLTNAAGGQAEATGGSGRGSGPGGSFTGTAGAADIAGTGTGGPATVSGGAGGGAAGGGSGGVGRLQGGNGVAALAAGGPGVVVGGTGGSSVAGTNDGGSGGSASVFGGPGGIGVVGQTGGTGGNALLDSGPGGLGVGGTPGVNGTVTIGATNALQVTIGRSSQTVTFPTGTIVSGMSRISNTAVIVASDTADRGERMIYDPTGGTFTLTAPATPSLADRWGVKNRSSDVTAITIAGNGSSIENPTLSFALAASFTMSGDGISVEWEYDGTQWLVV